MELIIISSKKSTSSQAIALPGGQEIQVPQPVVFALLSSSTRERNETLNEMM